MLHEISRRTIQLTKYEDIDMVWHNNVLTVRCDSGLHLFDFSYNLSCLDKSVDFFESKITTTKSSPATELFPKNGIKSCIKNMELSQMVLDPSLWPHNKQLMEVTIVVNFDWSPMNFIHNNESVLAVVNSAGNVDVYAQQRHKWTKLENLSIKLKCEMESKIPKLLPAMSYNGPVNFKIAKQAAYILETCSVCWCPVLNEDRSCYFVTAQKNGQILFWLLKHEDNQVSTVLIHHSSKNKEEIVTMKWIPTSVNRFILILSDVCGQIFAYECQILECVLEILNVHRLWPHKDKMIANYIEYEILNDNIVIACNKHRHLLSLIIDSHCEILFQNVKNINDQRITGLIKSNKRFYTSTVNRELFKIKFVIDNNCLDVHLSPIEIKGVSSVCELHSFAFSANDSFVALAMLDRSVLYRKLPLKLEIVFYTEETPELEFNKVINNPNKTLINLWDVIELTRCKSLKLKMLPKLDYNKLYEDAKTDIFYCKLYFILLTFYNNLEVTVQNGSRGVLPETSIETIKSNIHACHAFGIINKLCRIYGDDIIKNEADKFITDSLHMAEKYLKEFCNKNKIDLNEYLQADSIKILQGIKGPRYTCLWCDNDLNGFSCKDGHTNSFCSLTFTLIETDDYLNCRSCGAIAQSRTYFDNPKCIFCDLYLCNCYLPL